LVSPRPVHAESLPPKAEPLAETGCRRQAMRDLLSVAAQASELDFHSISALANHFKVNLV
jgi:hypothetical protein